MFAFDPIRREVFKWGFIAGVIGGFFFIAQGFVWQVIGILIVVLLANYHVNRAARRIPRWHATLNSMAGMALGMFGAILAASLFLFLLGQQ